jgi:protein O-mannosyl-transferase
MTGGRRPIDSRVDVGRRPAYAVVHPMMPTSGATSGPAPAPDPSEPGYERRRSIAAVLLLLAVLVPVYWPALGAPFLFEDVPEVLRNPSVVQLHPRYWVPGSAEAGGPLVRFSFAANHALGGFDVRGYRVANLLLHAACGALLLGIVRRTFASARALPAAVRRGAFPLALVTALVWLLHPVQTRAVTYISGRAELMWALFVLLTLYASIRSGGPAALRWSAMAVLGVVLGGAVSPAAAIAPLLVLMYDRAFHFGSVVAVWRSRRNLYLALGAASVLVAGAAAAQTVQGGTTAAGALPQLATQACALLRYLALAVWPQRLVFDYGPAGSPEVGGSWGCGVAVSGLALAGALAFRRRPELAFTGGWFLLVVLATSAAAPLASHPVAEHRVYLPLATMAAAVVAGGYACGGRIAAVALVAFVVGCAGVAAKRNQDFQTPLRIWADTVAKAPANARAHQHFAGALAEVGRAPEAIAHYEIALRLRPDRVAARQGLGEVLLQVGQDEAAAAQFQAVLGTGAVSAGAHADLAAVLARLGRWPEALQHFDAAVGLGLPPAQHQRRLGRALAEAGHFAEALTRLHEAQRLDPRDVETELILGMVLSALDRGAEALRHFTTAMTLQPNHPGARRALADALVESGRPAEAISHYEAALVLQPGEPAGVHTSLANALVLLGRIPAAIEHYERALRLDPQQVEARTNLARVRAAAQRRGLLKN